VKVIVLGGTGHLGYATAVQFLDHGDDVHTAALRPARITPAFDAGVTQHTLDLFRASPEELVTLLQGFDAMVYALGPDDRDPTPAPAREHFAALLVEQTGRIVRAARRAGVRRVVVLGSYFATMDRMHRQWRLAERHVYIQARIAQAQTAIAAGEESDRAPRTDVMVLELPYVFGVTPGRVPFWKDALFDRLLAMPVVTYPRGGTITTTTTQVAQAVRGAVLHGEHGRCYPIGDVTMRWTELIPRILAAVGRRPIVVTVPAVLAAPVMRAEKRAQERQGLESGLDPLRLVPDIVARMFTFDPAPSRTALGFCAGGVPEALRETVRACYPDPPDHPEG
jgi:nucleoside-diphosphate-sugar epimerase